MKIEVTDRLHPASCETLRQLIKLHGAEALIKTIRDIAKLESEKKP